MGGALGRRDRRSSRDRDRLGTRRADPCHEPERSRGARDPDRAVGNLHRPVTRGELPRQRSAARFDAPGRPFGCFPHRFRLLRRSRAHGRREARGRRRRSALVQPDRLGRVCRGGARTEQADSVSRPAGNRWCDSRRRQRRHAFPVHRAGHRLALERDAAGRRDPRGGRASGRAHRPTCGGGPAGRGGARVPPPRSAGRKPLRPPRGRSVSAGGRSAAIPRVTRGGHRLDHPARGPEDRRLCLAAGKRVLGVRDPPPRSNARSDHVGA